MAKFPLKNLIFLMQKHLSSSSSSATTSSVPCSSSFTIDYLVNSCGLTLQSAIAASGKVSLSEKNIQRHDSVVHVLRAHGFDSTHLPKLIQKQPRLLSLKAADENLKPKLEYLVENGFSGSQLHDLIVSNPSILGKSLSCRIKPSFQFLRSYLGSEERLRLALKRSPHLLTINLKETLQPNIELFAEEGVPQDAIAQFFITAPRRMLSSHERMLVGLQIFKDQYGNTVDPVASPNMFLSAISTLAYMGVFVWKRRVHLLKTLFGFSQEEVLSIFRSYPTCFTLSEETLRSKVDFCFNTLQFKPEVIIKYPNLLGLSLDKRIRPRYNVFKVLLSKKLLTEDSIHAQLFRLAEDKFVDKYVTQHLQQVPSLLEMYTKDKMKNKNDIWP